MSKDLVELSNALAQATDRAAGSVVAIHTERRGSSSGIVWRPGVIVTSEHALRRDSGTEHCCGGTTARDQEYVLENSILTG
jgi:hypothetical protein